VVEAPILEEEVVGCIVGDDEQRVLARPDDENGEAHGKRMRPEVKAKPERCGDDGEVVDDGGARLQGRAPREAPDHLRGQRLAEVVPELLAFRLCSSHAVRLPYWSMPPISTYFSSRYS